MSYVCEICGKSRMAGRHVSHAKNRSVRSTTPNLHRISLGRGLPQRRLCTTCSRVARASITEAPVVPAS